MRNILSLIVLSSSIIFITTKKNPNNTPAQAKQTIDKVKESISSEKEFLLNRFIVKYKDTTSLENIESSLETKGDFSINAFRERHPAKNKYKTVFIQNPQGLPPNMNVRNKNISETERNQKLEQLEEKLLEYSLDPNVEFAQPVYAYHISAWTRSGDQDYPSDFDSGGSNHWYYDKGNLRETWQDQDCQGSGSSCGGSNSVIVAVIDTGLAYEVRDGVTHPDTSYKQWYSGEPTDFDYGQGSEFNPSGGFNLYTNSAEENGDHNTNCFDGEDDDSNGYIDDCNGYNGYEDWMCYVYSCNAAQLSEAGHPNDDWGHGTYVTGLIASNIDNAVSVSPAHNVTIMPLKGAERITHSTHPQTSGPAFWSDDICNAVDYARIHGADVINMSFGGPSYDPLMAGCLNQAYNAGITLVAATGNKGLSSISYPARFSYVIAVGASDSGDNRAYYSNYGNGLDLVAAVGDGGAGNVAYQQSYNGSWGGYCDNPDPAYRSAPSCIVTGGSTWNLDDYTDYAAKSGTGTSYASPQVAAGAALVKTRMPDSGVIDVKSILTSTSTDIGSPGRDNSTGYGILNLEEIWNKMYFYPKNIWDNDFGNKGDKWFVGNFSSDSLSDLALVRDINTTTQRWHVTTSNGSSFNPSSVWDSDFGNRGDQWFVGDFNGDSLSDLALVKDINTITQRWHVTTSNGSSFNPSSVWDSDFGNRGDQWFVGDFNGDSLSDLALVKDINTTTQRWHVTTSNGSSFNPSSVWDSDFGNRGDQWFVGNFNNDSLSDLTLVRDINTITQRWHVTTSNGSSFNPSSIWSADFGNRCDEWFVGNFNNDNLSDLALVRYINTTTQRWYVSPVKAD